MTKAKEKWGASGSKREYDEKMLRDLVNVKTLMKKLSAINDANPTEEAVSAY